MRPSSSQVSTSEAAPREMQESTDTRASDGLEDNKHEESRDLAEVLDEERDHALGILASVFKKPAPVEEVEASVVPTQRRPVRSIIQKRYRPTAGQLDRAQEENEPQSPPTAEKRTESLNASSAVAGATAPREQVAAPESDSAAEGRRPDELKAYHELFYREHTLDTVKAFSDHSKTKRADFSFGFDVQAGGSDDDESAVASASGPSDSSFAAAREDDNEEEDEEDDEEEDQEREERVEEEHADDSTPCDPADTIFGFRTKDWEESVDEAFEKIRTAAAKARSQALESGSARGSPYEMPIFRLVLKGSRASFMQDYKRKMKAARKEAPRHRGRLRRRFP
uniref:Uncharacterized protein n=1 Tax=Pinguiococcus pyrenoidosus TaxID=172671 RepID=A0A7R9YAJ9_9STRA|mmetsp:Transcript_1618/g.7035  ORF Transcript_1618/g.7035 Transcript_1618/m.7035 type:complete len:339 (+) Transcript_1618:1-1017(+)